MDEAGEVPTDQLLGASREERAQARLGLDQVLLRIEERDAVRRLLDQEAVARIGSGGVTRPTDLLGLDVPFQLSRVPRPPPSYSRSLPL